MCAAKQASHSPAGLGDSQPVAVDDEGPEAICFCEGDDFVSGLLSMQPLGQASGPPAPEEAAGPAALLMLLNSVAGGLLLLRRSTPFLFVLAGHGDQAEAHDPRTTVEAMLCSALHKLRV